MEPEKRRDKLVTVLLFLMPVLNLLTSLGTLLIIRNGNWPDFTQMSVAAAVVVAATIAASAGVWKRKKWGFYLFIIACVAAAIITVFSLYLSVLAAVGATGAALFAAKMTPLQKYLD